MRGASPSGADCRQSAATRECGIASAPVAVMLSLERNHGSDRRLHEGVGERTCELMNGFPAGAVGR